jgi:hypothetical protein
MQHSCSACSLDAGGPHGGLDALLANGCDDEQGQNALLDGSYLLDLELARLRVAPQQNIAGITGLVLCALAL